MATQSLLLCRDPNVLGVLRPALTDIGFSASICDAADRALDLLQREKFNPVIVDCDQFDTAAEVLCCLRLSDANRDSIALGIVSDDAQMHGVYASGANFVLRKPLSAEETQRTLRTARSLVTRMRRHFLRCVVDALAYAHLEGIDDQPLILDICEGGMMIQGLEPLQVRRAFAMRFSLPGEQEAFEAVAVVAWSDVSGRSGLKFLGMHSTARERLCAWLEHSGASGPVEAPLSGEESREGVRFPLRLSPIVHDAVSTLMDFGLIGAAVALFTLITYGVAGDLPLPGTLASSLLLLACACWLLYRYVFFGAVAMTPGGHLTSALADRCLAWQYNRGNL